MKKSHLIGIWAAERPVNAVHQLVYHRHTIGYRLVTLLSGGKSEFSTFSEAARRRQTKSLLIGGLDREARLRGSDFPRENHSGKAGQYRTIDTEKSSI